MTKRNNLIIKSKILLCMALVLTQFAHAKEFKWTKESPKRLSWYDAKKYCTQHKARLPKYEEIESVWLKNNKSADIKGFDLSVSYWTSKIEPNNYDAAHPFYFGDGKKGWYYKADHYGVRCIKK